MKTLLLLVIMLSLWFVPTSGQCGSNQVDLDGKGLNHLSKRGENPLSAGRKAQDRLSAQQGKKAMADVQKQQAKNQAEWKKNMDYMRERTAPLTK